MKHLLLALLAALVANVACAAAEPVELMKTMDGFRAEVPPAQTLSEQNGFSLKDVNGKEFLLTRLDGVARRMGAKTKGECLVLLTYLKDQDPKIRFIAAHAIEQVVHAYPDGMSLDDILKLDSKGHREMVRRFVEKLTAKDDLAGGESAPPAVPREWQTVRGGEAFTFRAPADLKAEPVQGVDSLVGKYASPAMEVTFDYGRYSDPINGEGYRSRDVTVDGKSARLVSRGDVVAIHFAKVGEDAKLTMSVRLKNADAKTVAETLLQSIDFP